MIAGRTLGSRDQETKGYGEGHKPPHSAQSGKAAFAVSAKPCSPSPTLSTFLLFSSPLVDGHAVLSEYRGLSRLWRLDFHGWDQDRNKGPLQV